jgi:hypothetical protein
MASLLAAAEALLETELCAAWLGHYAAAAATAAAVACESPARAHCCVPSRVSSWTSTVCLILRFGAG